QFVRRGMLEHAADDVLEWSPPWALAQLEYLHEHRGAELGIGGDPQPDLYAGIDGERVGRARPRELGRRSAEVIFRARTINWAGVAYPTEGWASGSSARRTSNASGSSSHMPSGSKSQIRLPPGRTTSRRWSGAPQR